MDTDDGQLRLKALGTLCIAHTSYLWKGDLRILKGGKSFQLKLSQARNLRSSHRCSTARAATAQEGHSNWPWNVVVHQLYSDTKKPLQKTSPLHSGAIPGRVYGIEGSADFTEPYQPTRTLRFSDSGLPVSSWIPKCRSEARLVSYQAPLLWNHWAASVRAPDTLSMFKRRLSKPLCHSL